MTETSDLQETYITLTADIVAAHVSNNSVAVSDIPTLIHNVHTALVGLGGPVVAEPVKLEPAVSIRSSIKPDYIVCLDDGKKLKMLKRHLMTHYGITPEQYRTKWGLPADYPMVAPIMRSSAAFWPSKLALAASPASASKPRRRGGRLICPPSALWCAYEPID